MVTDDLGVDDAGIPVQPAPRDAGRPGSCVASVARGAEATDALCSNGVDDDCNGYVDCNDYHCSRNAAVHVCGSDAGAPVVDVPAADVPAADAPPLDVPAGSVGPHGGTVDLLHFGVFGDMRPPNDNDTAMWPTSVVDSVIAGFAAEHAEFVIGTGDYMFANNATTVNAQISMLLQAEAALPVHFFHGMGNHECIGASTSNCPNGNEYANPVGFHTRLAAAYPNLYYDFTVATRNGDAHFILTAPNAWNAAQQTWLDAALARPATYTVVAAHEPPGNREAVGSPFIEASIAARRGGVTLRLYGHTHEYRHAAANAVISGNAGAPLASTSGSYGVVMVDQRADGNLVVTAYDVGRPPMVADSFVVTPAGTLTR